MENREPLEPEELERVEGELLPEREVMSVISTGLGDDPVPLPVDPPLRGGEQL